jgi:hypothetical protein
MDWQPFEHLQHADPQIFSQIAKDFSAQLL